MSREKDAVGVALGLPERARSATGGDPSAAAEVKRWSTNRKREVVLRLLRGESVDAISREVSVPIYKLEQWRYRALAGIDSGLKERENDPIEKQLGEANRRIGELVMEVDILQKERRGKHPFGRSEVIAMSRETSAGSDKPYGLERICRVLDLPRSTIYAQQGRESARVVSLHPVRRGPKPKIPDADLLLAIRTDLDTSPFIGEGHRKVWARLRILHSIRVSRARVLRLMRENA